MKNKRERLIDNIEKKEREKMIFVNKIFMKIDGNILNKRFD